MQVIISETYASMSKKAAEDLLRTIQDFAKPLICTASGNSPTGLYNELILLIRENRIDTSNWLFVSLDEWKGLNETDEGSCRFMLNEQLFHPLAIKVENICFFDGRAADLQEECRRIEEFIHLNGGIDVAIVGLGMNGHIGMNEPGTPFSSRSHIAAIDPVTQQVGQKYFSKPQVLDSGVTLGLSTIIDSEHIYLLVNGSHKASIVSKLLQEEISEDLPATVLRNHSGLKIFLDKEAAATISLQ